MEYKIESSIEMPTRFSYGKGRFCKYPFGQMNIGDSFIISEEYSRESMSKYSNAARNFGKTQNPVMKFSTRKVEGSKIRIWRVK